MMAAAVDDFGRIVVDRELTRLTAAFREQVAPACQLLAGRYPFVRNAPSEIGLPEFGRLFAPNGVLDAFFKQSLTRYVDTGKASWTYRPEYPLTARLSTTSLRAFQQAAQIRDAFFPMGGTLPNVSLTVYPPPLSGVAGLTAKFEVNGQEVTSSAGTSAVPRQIQWPGGGGGHAEVSLSVEQQQFASSDGALVGGVGPTTQQPPQTWTKIERTGAWALFKLIDAAGPPSYIGDRLNTSFLFGRRTLTFGLQTGSSLKPLTLPALREFRCPTQL
jgi:type VI secretion system protein ImpL